MAAVVITAAAQAEFDAIPLPIRARVLGVIARLANWPNVSGAKPLRGTSGVTGASAPVTNGSSST